MNIQDAVRQVLEKVPALTQKDIATDAAVNRGQLNVWLRQDGPLSDERQAKVVQSLLTLLDQVGKNEGRNYRVELSEVVRFLEAHIQRAPEPRDTYSDLLSPRDPLYIERADDRRLTSWLAADPLWAAIIGGPKKGKSSLLNSAEYELKRRGSSRPATLILRVDFANFRRDKVVDSRIDILPWFARQCEEQIGQVFGNLLLRPPDFTLWLEKNVIPSSPRVAFLLDHVERLWNPDNNARLHRSGTSAANSPYGDLETLFTAFHQFLDRVTTDPGLDRCKFIFALDRQHKAFDPTGLGRHSSSVLDRMNLLLATNFQESLVARLLEKLGFAASAAQSAATDALRAVGGHPYLTQAWARERLHSDDSLATAWAVLERSFREQWPAPLWDRLCSIAINDELMLSSTIESGQLVQSGLVQRTHIAQEGDKLRPVGEWIRNQLRLHASRAKRAKGPVRP